VPSAFTAETGKAHWHTLLKARAIENSAFVLAPAQTGRHPEKRRTFGHSLVVEPWGNVLIDAGDRPGVYIVHLPTSADLIQMGGHKMPLQTFKEKKKISLNYKNFLPPISGIPYPLQIDI